jgi:hypothetical protein
MPITKRPQGSATRVLERCEKLDVDEETWPPLNLWSLLGISQHYGVPTRLMDWTRRAKVACYFAASEAARKLSAIEDLDKRLEMGLKKLSVWAFAFDRFSSFFNREDAAYFGEPSPPPAPVVKVTAPHAHNPNLHAQDGLFSLQRSDMAGKLNHAVDRSPLDTFVEQFLIKNEMNTYGKELFFRIRLNWGNAAQLMWRLRQEGIGKATIYPGYGGVVAALEEEHLHG